MDDVERAWLGNTNMWDSYMHAVPIDFHIVEDEEMPDWLEEERHEECFGVRWKRIKTSLCISM